MTSIVSINPAQSFHYIYNSIMSMKSKDKVDMVLEPLQSMIQLALLSICPIGTKLHIQENILYLQTPTITQPLTRWYHSDKKDDLYFLYAVIKRFIKWYNPTMNNKSPISAKLYKLISDMSMEGLNTLFKTYSTCDSNTVIHVLQMYRNLLEFNNNKILMDDAVVDEKHQINIDEVFERIIHIYDATIVGVIYNTLTLIKQEPNYEYQQSMIDGFNLLLNKYNKLIKEWVKLNLVL